MAQISKYQLNTHYTALKQLPDQYSITLNFGGTYGYSLGRVLASGNIYTPAGSYVETALMNFSRENVNYLTHSFIYNLNNYAYLVFSLNQISSTTYQAKVVLTNTASSTVTISNSTLRVLLRLAIAPFSF